VDLYYGNKGNISGSIAREQIYNWIDNSDIVLVLITGNTVIRAMSVCQKTSRAWESFL
jgi:hypothetical protein